MSKRYRTPQRWAYNEQGQDLPVLITEAEIIRTYFPYWSRQMRKVGKAHLISRKLCIEDWVIVNWAWKPEGKPPCSTNSGSA